MEVEDSMQVEYDSRVIIEFAGRLYSQAKNIVVTYTVAGVVIFGAVGALVAAATENTEEGLIAAATLAFIGGAIGYTRGQERGFTLKLQAQTALCQLQIEQNTRPR
jgi:hypothetical protein